jgi:hypothetical protein
VSGAFVREDEERAARLELQTLEKNRATLLAMLQRERKRIETDPGLSELPALKKQKMIERIEKNMTELQAEISTSSRA